MADVLNTQTLHLDISCLVLKERKEEVYWASRLA